MKNQLTERWGAAMDTGFTAIPNLLLEHYDDLGITGDELLFLIHLLKHQDGYIIHDTQISTTHSAKTLQRRRTALLKKGLLQYFVIRSYDPVTEKHITNGIKYDLTPLYDQVQALSTTISDKTVHSPGQTCPSAEPKLSRDETPVTTLYNTNYNTNQNTIYYRDEIKLDDSKGESIENELEDAGSNFLSQYASLYRARHGVEFRPPDTLIRRIEKSSSEYLSQITDALPYWYDFTDEMNKSQSKQLDGSAYLLLKSGELIQKFLRYADVRHRNESLPIHALTEKSYGLTMLPHTNSYVRRAVQKIFGILSLKSLREKVTREIGEREKHYARTLDSVLDIFEYLRDHTHLRSEIPLWRENPNINTDNALLHYETITRSFEESISHLSGDMTMLKEQGMRYAHFNSFLTVARFFPQMFSAEERDTFFGPLQETAQHHPFERIDREVALLREVYEAVREYKESAVAV